MRIEGYANYFKCASKHLIFLSPTKHFSVLSYELNFSAKSFHGQAVTFTFFIADKTFQLQKALCLLPEVTDFFRCYLWSRRTVCSSTFTEHPLGVMSAVLGEYSAEEFEKWESYSGFLK